MASEKATEADNDVAQAKLAFYFAPGSCSLAPHICLFEAGAEFEPIAVMLANGQQHTPAYRAINPRGRIPALVAGSQVITENIAVISYLAARFPAAKLLPLGDPSGLGRAYELMSWYASSLHVWIAEAWRTERFTTDEALWPPLKSHATVQLDKAFHEINELCANAAPWVLGEQFSAVDAYTLIFWRWGERLGLDMTQHRAWAEHRDRMLARPSVKAALEAEKQATQVAAPVQ